jgi:hypothetical protein
MTPDAVPNRIVAHVRKVHHSILVAMAPPSVTSSGRGMSKTSGSVVHGGAHVGRR